MVARPHLRRDHSVSGRVLLGCVLALALLASRTAVSHFPSTTSRHWVRTTHFSHFGQNQCLAHSDVPAAAPAAAPLPDLVPQLALPSPVPPPLLSFLSDGAHHNRPPPIA